MEPVYSNYKTCTSISVFMKCKLIPEVGPWNDTRGLKSPSGIIHLPYKKDSHYSIPISLPDLQNISSRDKHRGLHNQIQVRLALLSFLRAIFSIFKRMIKSKIKRYKKMYLLIARIQINGVV